MFFEYYVSVCGLPFHFLQCLLSKCFTFIFSFIICVFFVLYQTSLPTSVLLRFFFKEFTASMSSFLEGQGAFRGLRMHDGSRSVLRFISRTLLAKSPVALLRRWPFPRRGAWRWCSESAGCLCVCFWVFCSVLLIPFASAALVVDCDSFISSESVSLSLHTFFFLSLLCLFRILWASIQI